MDKINHIQESKNYIKEVIDNIDKRRDEHTALAKLLEKILYHLFPYAPKVEARTKAIGSIAGKILKKYIHLGDAKQIFEKLTDIVGARAIFLRKDHVQEADDVIRRYFTVDDVNTQDVGERLSDSEFGYQSHHYTIICNKNWIDKIVNNELTSISDKEISIKDAINISQELQTLTVFFNINTGEKIYAELQIRTWLQHVWADLSHDAIYKGDREIPRKLRRIWSSIAAVLENADENIMKCLDELEKYRTNVTYYIKKELDQKIDDLEIVNEFLTPEYHTGNEADSQWAALELKKNEAQLKRLKALRGPDERTKQTTWAAPIVSLDDIKMELKKDSTHPRWLLYYLVERKDLSYDVILESLLKDAIRRCDYMIASSLELPWAFAGKAFFLLYMNWNITAKITDDTELIYDAVLRLIDLCNERSVANLGNEQIVATKDSWDALAKLKEAVDAMTMQEKTIETIQTDSDIAPLKKCVSMMLDLGFYAHLESMSMPSKQTPAVIIAGGCGALEEKQELEDFKVFFKNTLTNSLHKITFLTGGGNSGICTLDLGNNFVECFGIKTENNAQHQSPYKIHSLYEALMEWEYLKDERYRFADIALVGFGLGPISGFECRIALALGARVTVIGYKEFLQSYDKIFAKIPHWSEHPSLVQLPIIQGDKPKNKSFEKNMDWQKIAEECKKLKFPEPMMLRVFMLFKPFNANDYCKKKKDSLLLLIHRIKRLKTEVEPKDFYKLDKDKQLSERHRLLSFKQLYTDVPGLKEIIEKEAEEVMLPGYKAKITPDKLKDWLDDIKEPDLIDYRFSEREHARWYIERWLQGTRYGSNKIDKGVPAYKKKNPCMVAWYDLDDDTIIKDTDFLKRYIVAEAVSGNKTIVDGIEKFFKDNDK